MTAFLFLGSKITADCDCSHEIRRRLLLGRKAMTNRDGVLKSRDVTLPTKVHTVKGFAIVNKAKIDVFWNSLAFSIIQQMLAI